MNYAFYVSGNAGRLRKIIESREAYLKDVKVIISDDEKNADIRMLVQEIGDINYVLIDYKSLSGERNETLSDLILGELKKYKIDYCFSFGNHILKGELLKQYKNRIINFHPSLLPAFRGRNAIDQAIEANAFLLGCTAHFIDEGMDTGAVIMQSVMSQDIFGDGDYDSVLQPQIEMMRRIVNLLNSGRIEVVGNCARIQGADYSKIRYYPEM